MYIHEPNIGVRAGKQYRCEYFLKEFYLEGVFIATIVSAIVFPSMLISAVAPFDKNSLQKRGSEVFFEFQMGTYSKISLTFFFIFESLPGPVLSS